MMIFLIKFNLALCFANILFGIYGHNWSAAAGWFCALIAEYQVWEKTNEN